MKKQQIVEEMNGMMKWAQTDRARKALEVSEILLDMDFGDEVTELQAERFASYLKFVGNQKDMPTDHAMGFALAAAAVRKAIKNIA